MMKILVISFIALFSQFFFACTGNDPILLKTYGTYKLADTADFFPNEEVRYEVLEWVYENGYDTITIEKDIVIFGWQTIKKPTYRFLPMNEEYVVYFPSVKRSFTCSGLVDLFPGIERLYNVVLEIEKLIGVWCVELMDNKHIVIQINNMFILYEKLPPGNVDDVHLGQL
jgi:hypothetical protein